MKLYGDGTAPKTADIHGALDDLVASGELPADLAARLKIHSGPVVGGALAPIIGQTMRRMGLQDYLNDPAANPPGPSAADFQQQQPQRQQPQPGNPAPGSLPPVRDPIRWQAAREDAKSHVNALEAAATAAGKTELAQTVRAMGGEKFSDAKVRLALNYLTAHPSPFAQRLLTDPLLLRGASRAPE